MLRHGLRPAQHDSLRFVAHSKNLSHFRTLSTLRTFSPLSRTFEPMNKRLGIRDWETRNRKLISNKESYPLEQPPLPTVPPPAGNAIKLRKYCSYIQG